jgi:hypothetical protein
VIRRIPAMPVKKDRSFSIGRESLMRASLGSGESDQKIIVIHSDLAAGHLANCPLKTPNCDLVFRPFTLF